MSVKLSSLCPRFDELSRNIALPMLTEAGAYTRALCSST
jgi:hypothetical protein